MSIVVEILKELSNTEVKYGGMSVNLFGIPRFSSYSKRSLRSSADRLARNELIRKELNGFIITPKGREFLKKKHDSFKSFQNSFSKNAPKNLLVMFDVPVAQKAER